MKKGDIITLVLTNGAEIIGEFVDAGADTYTVNRPRMLQASQSGVGLVDGVCMSGEKPEGNMEINKTGVIFVIETVDEIAKGYKQQVTGLVLSTSGITS
jgi:hypothetical protein